MRHLIILSIISSLATGCTTIEVNPDDSTLPGLTVSLTAPSTVSAHYTDDDAPVDGIINTSRHFRVEPRNDSQRIQLIYKAVDEQSGVSQIRSSLQISYRCSANIIGGSVSRVVSTTISGVFFERAGAGETTPVSRLLLTEFTYEDLWRRGNCTTWDAVTNVESGSLSDIEVNYTGRAWNNSVPASAATEINGRFSVTNGRVDISR